MEEGRGSPRIGRAHVLWPALGLLVFGIAYALALARYGTGPDYCSRVPGTTARWALAYLPVAAGGPLLISGQYDWIHRVLFALWNLVVSAALLALAYVLILNALVSACLE
jgi:hypothetical protein